MKRNCIICNQEFKFTRDRIDTAKYCSFKCRDLDYKNRFKPGPTHQGWKNKVSYGRIHVWLKETFGNPPLCEHCNKIGFNNGQRWNIQWALIKGRKYLRDRNNYFGLCASCHRKYDFIEETRKKMSLAQIGRTPWNKGLKMKG